MLTLQKFIRYCQILGFRRSVVKSVGRLRLGFPLWLLLSPLKRSKTKVGLIGAGQFGFSTISYFLTLQQGRCLAFVADKDLDSARSLANCYGVPKALKVEQIVTEINEVDIVYIASNHASHTSYALECIERGVDVYIEKPISVNEAEFNQLKSSINNFTGNVYFGYNRPFSPAVREIVKRMGEKPLTLNCMVVGHFINDDHWYRLPQEGTRVCGNLGHWLDLSVHFLCKKNVKFKELNVSISYSNPLEFDDNITVTLVSDLGDLMSVTLTSRSEPFEGISETIVFQQQDLLVNIDDFRRATFQIGAKKLVRNYRPKDVGHRNAILQPFSAHSNRTMEEVFISTELMLHITSMVRRLETNSVFKVE